MIFDNLAILAHFRPTLANWVDQNGYWGPVLQPRTPRRVPMGAHNIAKYHIRAFGGNFGEKMGPEGQNGFKT